jgi:hypothetical protein
MIHTWTLGLIFTVSGLLATLPAFGAAMGKAQKRAGDASYWKQQRRLQKRINEVETDAFLAGGECSRTLGGGYGPVCGHAVDQLTDAINRIADWRDEAEKLHPADAAFHKQWLRSIDCRREKLKSEKAQAQLLQTHSLESIERAADLAKAELDKSSECTKPAVEMMKRKKALGIRDEE